MTSTYRIMLFWFTSELPPQMNVKLLQECTFTRIYTTFLYSLFNTYMLMNAFITEVFYMYDKTPVKRKKSTPREMIGRWRADDNVRWSSERGSGGRLLWKSRKTVMTLAVLTGQVLGESLYYCSYKHKPTPCMTPTDKHGRTMFPLYHTSIALRGRVCASAVKPRLKYHITKTTL